MYEQQMVRNQITQLTGRTFLPGYASAEDEYRALMTNGANYAKEFGLVPGMALTAAQMDALTSDIVWLVDQTVTLPDGSTTHVLVPVVYMAQTHANDLQPTGALIAADDVEIHTTGSTTNTGVIKGGTKTVLTATDILNRGGTISSSGKNGTTVVSASNDVVNASGQITGNRVAVLAGRDIVNTTLVDSVGATGASGASKVSTSLLGQQGTIIDGRHDGKRRSRSECARCEYHGRRQRADHGRPRYQRRYGSGEHFAIRDEECESPLGRKQHDQRDECNFREWQSWDSKRQRCDIQGRRRNGRK
jgi:adhesin HecA-like repeat protein